jgi:hypothetical protein
MRGLLFLVAASTACDPFVGDVSHSRFFEYHDQVHERLCPSLLAKLDLHAQMQGEKLGLTLDENHPYRYFKFRDNAAFAANSAGCPPENGACALGNEVYSASYFHAHEQAHDYAFRAWGGWSDGLINEGQAVAMSCTPFYELEPNQKPTDVVGRLDWRDLLNLFGNSNEGYGAAGFFVTALANQYGWPRVGELYKKVPRHASADTVAQAFAALFPTSIDEAWSAALTKPGAAPCQKDWRCLATAMAPGDVATPDCDGEMHRRVDVVAPGGVVLSLVGDNSSLMLLSCSDATPTAYTLESGPAKHPTTHWASLPPGSYTMFPGQVALPANVTLQSNFSATLVGDSCAAASAVVLDPSGSTSIDLLAGRVDGWMRLAGGGHSYDVSPYNLFWSDLTIAGPVSICTDCRASACLSIPYGQTTRVIIGNSSVVRFQNVMSSPPPSGAWGQLRLDATPG